MPSWEVEISRTYMDFPIIRSAIPCKCRLVGHDSSFARSVISCVIIRWWSSLTNLQSNNGTFVVVNRFLYTMQNHHFCASIIKIYSGQVWYSTLDWFRSIFEKVAPGMTLFTWYEGFSFRTWTFGLFIDARELHSIPNLAICEHVFVPIAPSLNPA